MSLAQARTLRATENKLYSIDVLEEKILKDKKRKISAFRRVQDSLDKKKYTAALKSAKALEANSEFKDYYHYLSGQAELGRLKHAFSTRKFANAILAGEQAVYHFVQVQGTNPYTTLQKRASVYLGETEIALAESYIKTRKRKKATEVFENGFQRLLDVKLLALVPKKSIVTYALLCEKKASDMCRSWVAKLAPFVKHTKDAKLLSRIAAFKRPYIEREYTQRYRVDLDAQEFQKGFDLYIEAKYEEAFSVWRELLKEYPHTNYKLRTKFWMGRAAQRAGEPVKAQTLYREVIRDTPFAYYSLLASWFGGIDLSRMMDAELPVATSETPLLTPAEVVRIRRAETLIASGVPELALLELQDVRPTLNMPNEFLVYLSALNHMAGNHLATFHVFSELSSRNFQGLYSSYGQKLYFPMVRLPEIKNVSKDWNLDPLLVLSVVKQESAFNHEAVSWANAFGLMQIIPSTARDLDPKIEIADLFEPLRNLNLGSKYLARLLKRYDGNVALALAAYNAGPGNADRWKRAVKKDTPLEELIEQITYKETREYVQSILRNFYWYSRRVRGESMPSLGALVKNASEPGSPATPGPAPLKAPEVVEDKGKSDEHAKR